MATVQQQEVFQPEHHVQAQVLLQLPAHIQAVQQELQQFVQAARLQLPVHVQIVQQELQQFVQADRPQIPVHVLQPATHQLVLTNIKTDTIALKALEQVLLR